MPATEIRSTQMVLPLEELETTFDLDIERAEFVSQYILAANNGAEAMRRVKAATNPNRNYSDRYLRKRACVLLQEEEVARAIELRRRHSALGAAATEAEFYRGVRTVLQVALGLEPVKKTLVATSKEGIQTHDAEVYDPNMAAATKSLEMLARAQGLLSDKVKVELPVVRRFFDGTVEELSEDDVAVDDANRGFTQADGAVSYVD